MEDFEKKRSCDQNVVEPQIKKPRLDDSTCLVGVVEEPPAAVDPHRRSAELSLCRWSQSSNRCRLEFGPLVAHTGVWGEKGVRKVMEDMHLICLSVIKQGPQNLPRGNDSAVNDSPLPPQCDISLFGVFDGHGGKQSVGFVAENLATEVYRHLAELYHSSSSFESGLSTSTATALRDENPASLPATTDADSPTALSLQLPITDRAMRRILTRAFLSLDARLAAELPGSKDGTTAVVLAIPHSFVGSPVVYTASVGDTAAFLCRVDCHTKLHAIPLSQAHKPWDMKEKERIISCGGAIENSRVNGLLEVSRSIGDLHLKKFGVVPNPTFSKFTVSPDEDEFVLIGCDGFWSSWTSEEALEFTRTLLLKEKRRLVAAGHSVQLLDVRMICKSAVEHLLVAKNCQDNVSVMCMLFLNTKELQSQVKAELRNAVSVAEGA